ncbi:hypothetical protein BH09ACT4_BH09ACT4_05670 [soil metagenome]
MTPDSTLLQVQLRRQAAALAPVAIHLQAAMMHPPISPHDWYGPASLSYADLETRLRARIAAAGDAVESALRSTRVAIGQLDG